MVLLVLIFVGYWLPTIVAGLRNVPNKNSVVIIDLFLGWTVIGWIVALAMAFSGDGRPRGKSVKQVLPVHPVTTLIAGWYPNPVGAGGGLRYFDGSTWTNHIHPS